MSIVHTPLGECLYMLDGKPYRVGEFSYYKHPHGFECVVERMDNLSFLIPNSATLIDAQYFVTVFNTGYIAGLNASRSDIKPDGPPHPKGGSASQ